MEFKKFNELIQNQFEQMTKTGMLFRADITGQQIWDLYLKSFENDPVFRDPNSSQHNCNHCNNFIRRYGNIVTVNTDLNIVTLFDVTAKDEYKAVAEALSKTIRSYKIVGVFFETFSELNLLPYERCSKNSETFQLGVGSNVKQYNKAESELYGVVAPEEIRTFNHFHLHVPKQFVNQTGASIEAVMAGYYDKKTVFKRAMEEIPLDTLELVKDLINQGSLLDGTTHLHSVEEMLHYKEIYEKGLVTSDVEIDIAYWVDTYGMSERTAKFKNTLVGVLCSELAEGKELNKACQNWNKRVDPVNYHKAVAPITQKQIKEAQKFVEENGYVESFDRRLAVIEDIKVSEIKHINSGNGEIQGISIFDNVKSTRSRHKRNQYDNVEEVSIEKFMKDILPSCTIVEALLQNKHEGNLVTLTTANNPESKSIFKWINNYSYTFKGNLAGKSQIKEAVKIKGGKVDGILRFSIMWAEKDASDNSDLDAWCKQPSGFPIGFSSDKDARTRGNLDIDITNPASHGHKNIVENITWPNLNLMPDGVYKFWINQYSNRGSKGFRAEIEFDGELYSYEYTKPVHGDVQIAEVTLKNGVFSIKHLLESSEVNKEMYALETNDFHKVNLVCLSPNHWGNDKVGNKYYLFMLEGCKTPHNVRSFHNEHLIPDLLKHRKVMEVLGASTMVEATDKQLSGLGFNSTVKDELILRLSGNFKRMLKIKF